MESTKAIEAIQYKIELLSKTEKTEDFNLWQKSTVLTLVNIYNESDKRILSFENIRSYNHYGISGIDRFPNAKVEAKKILTSIIKDIQDFGIIKSSLESKVGGVNVNVNQFNTQNQSTNVNIDLKIILDVIKDELRGSEIVELKEILESKEEPKEKKKKFVDKIKSFGVDVSSNILANLLTNPMVFEQFGKMI